MQNNILQQIQPVSLFQTVNDDGTFENQFDISMNQNRDFWADDGQATRKPFFSNKQQLPPMHLNSKAHLKSIRENSRSSLAVGKKSERSDVLNTQESIMKKRNQLNKGKSQTKPYSKQYDRHMMFLRPNNYNVTQQQKGMGQTPTGQSNQMSLGNLSQDIRSNFQSDSGRNFLGTS